MIAYLKGTIKFRGEGWVILVAHEAFGYKIFTPATPGLGETTEFFIHHHIREDSEDLYGFGDMETLELFEMLLSVSGVGPKVGMAILNTGPVEKIKAAIIKGDTTMLTAVGGVGKKVAAKIIVELKGKISGIGGTFLPEEDGEGADILEALEQLGYKKAEIAPVLREVPEDLSDTQAKLRWILQRMKKK